MRKPAPALVSMLLLAGCAVGPDYVRPDVAVPDQWSTSRDGGETDAPVTAVEWWKELNDPTLTSLVERAVQSNLDLRLAEARVREARAARGIAASALWPTLNASGAYARSQAIEPDIATGPSVTAGGSVGPGGITPSISVRGQNVSVSRMGLGDGATTSVSVTAAMTDVATCFRWDSTPLGNSTSSAVTAAASRPPTPISRLRKRRGAAS